MKKITIILMSLLCAVMVFCTAFDETDTTAGQTLIGLLNPWQETDPDGLMQTLGLEFEVPEDAENVIYRMNESEKTAEMQFTLYDMPFVARIKPAGLEMEDISGMNYEWEFEEESDAHFYREKLMEAKDGDETVQVYLWFDIVPGLTYSLSARGEDLDGFDIIAVAQMVYHQTQGEV